MKGVGMREYIHAFKQERALNLNLSHDELLLLDYFKNFFHEGRARFVVVSNEKYYLIRYPKMIKDLSILGKNSKLFQRMISELERKEILRRHVQNGRDLYIRVDWDKLLRENDDLSDRQICLNLADVLDNPGTSTGQKRPAIVNYNNNDLYNNILEAENIIKERVLISEFMKTKGRMTYDCWFKDMKLLAITDEQIQFEFRSKSCADYVRQKHLNMLNEAVRFFLKSEVRDAI
jgi:hypothetical protein